MGSCRVCHGRGQVENPGSFFGWSPCNACSGTGQEPTGKPADWFFGDADKKSNGGITGFGGGGRKKSNGGCTGFGLLVILILIALVIAGISAASGAEDVDNHPEITYPHLWENQTVVFDPEGVRYKWRLKPTVENYDKRLGMFNQWVGNCAKHPKAQCIRVREVNRPHWKTPDGNLIWGLWRSRKMMIVLNVAHGRVQDVVSHEMGHMYGIGHHNDPGAVGQGARFASRAEIRVIRRHPNY